MLKIEKGIPVPEEITKHKAKYPFAEMIVGDSFLAESTDFVKTQINVLASASRHKPMKFTTRRVDGGIRCWRIF